MRVLNTWLIGLPPFLKHARLIDNPPPSGGNVHLSPDPRRILVLQEPDSEKRVA